MVENQGKRERTFKEFKSYFYGAFDDPTVFDCQEFNLLKVVQEGLKIGYDFNTRWGSSFWKFKLIHLFNRLKLILSGKSNPFTSNSLAQFKKRPYLLLDVGRYTPTEDGRLTSLYFDRIKESIPENERTFGLERIYIDPKIPYDFIIHPYLQLADYLPIGKEEKQLYLDLCRKLDEWKGQVRFSQEEFDQIHRSLSLFWTQFRVWNFLFKQLAPETCILVCHYHKEGLILALNRNRIKAIELQHGLIAKEDIFYVYPPKVAAVTERALFADEIWTYGDYWKEVLLEGVEYPAHRIQVAGYYPYEKKSRNQALIDSLLAQADDAPILLITTQNQLFQIFIDYVLWLSQDMLSKNLKGLIIVKPHPANAVGTFAALDKLPNVLVSRDDLYDLFTASDIHVSIYSTTLFEAIRLNLTNYSLYIDSCADYVQNILESKIAKRLEWGVNPFELENDSTSVIQSDYYFFPFSSFPGLDMDIPSAAAVLPLSNSDI